mmetsp:Transcript_310/g.446  ORF Transcript_310/g.446 Transcript_310/m.446 type:complete len:306 (+) Transcript_310:152-1069(+)
MYIERKREKNIMTRLSPSGLIISAALFTTSSCCTAFCFVPHQRASKVAGLSTSKPSALFMSDQWDDEDAGAAEELLKKAFDDASVTLLEESEAKDLEEMGDFDQPMMPAEDPSVIRDTVQSRSGTLGLDESLSSKEAIEAATAYAEANMGEYDAPLDLSQVTDGDVGPFIPKSGGTKGPSPTFDEIENFFEEELRNEIDPLGTKSFYEQFMYEAVRSRFPKAKTVALKTVVLGIVGVLMGIGVIKYDRTVRAYFVREGILPSLQEIYDSTNADMELARQLSQSSPVSVQAVSEAAVKEGINLPDI